jgi:hypothetical protein
MTTDCCYCERILDIKRLTPHKILTHKVHEKPTDIELNNIMTNNKYYYFPKFFYDDGYVNIPYNDDINIMIIDALINNMTEIEIEFKSIDGFKNHMINLQTMMIDDLDKTYCCLFKETKHYDLAVQFNIMVVYRDILFDNNDNKKYPLRTEYFNFVLSKLQNKEL